MAGSEMVCVFVLSCGGVQAAAAVPGASFCAARGFVILARLARQGNYVVVGAVALLARGQGSKELSTLWSLRSRCECNALL